MIDMLKPARDILAELNRLKENMWIRNKILIHGVGKVQNVAYHDWEWNNDKYYWEFIIKLNDGIQINCVTKKRKKEDENYLYFEEGDVIEFFGVVNTYDRGIFCRYNVSNLFLYDAKLSDEERPFSEVLMWNIKTHEGKVAIMIDEELRMIESQIAVCIGELEETPEDKWAYGHLVKKGRDIILQLDKMM